MEIITLNKKLGVYIDVEYLADLVNDRVELIRYNSNAQDLFQEALLEKFGYLLDERDLSKESINANRDEFKKRALEFYEETK